MKLKALLLALAVLAAAVLAGGCYRELALRDFSKAGQQTLDGWHLIPFGDYKFTEAGLALGRATFSIPLVLGEEFNLRIEMDAKLEGVDLNEFGLCLSQEKVYLSNLGNNIIIRTQSLAGSSSYEAFSVNFIVKSRTFASGQETLPGFKLKGKNVISLWKKKGEFGWTVNGKKSGPYDLPSDFQSGLYIHFNIDTSPAVEEAITITRIRVTGPQDSASGW
jgi:hypothetical protein